MTTHEITLRNEGATRTWRPISKSLEGMSRELRLAVRAIGGNASADLIYTWSSGARVIMSTAYVGARGKVEER
jgi:hypothetical protein